MRCLTVADSAEWLRTQGIAALSDDGSPSAFGYFEVFCRAPKDFRCQQRLARDLVKWLGQPQSALLWITGWPFYKSDEMSIASALRLRHGESRLLLDAPGHVFLHDEMDELTAWVYLLIGFGWDGYVFASPYPGAMFQTSHEDFVWLMSDNVDRFSEAQRIARESRLEILRRTNV